MFTALVMSAVMGTGLACPDRTINPTGTGTAAAYTLHDAAWRGEKDIVETAVGAGSFGTLCAALKAAGLVETLKGAGPFTVFAPTDEAFAALPAGTVESLLKAENKEKLRAVLLYHVAPGSQDASAVLSGHTITTLNGQRADVSRREGGAFIDGARIVKTDVGASNGVIHVIDKVILPESRTIPQIAEGAGSFGTLLAAVKAAGLEGTLSGQGPYTVFAPTDEAFAKLPAGTVEGLLKPENREKLRSILLYHVVPGRVYSDQAAGMHEASTAADKKVKIRSKDGKVMVGAAGVTAADIDAGNGVVHVIDTVLLPE